MNYFLSNTHQ